MSQTPSVTKRLPRDRVCGLLPGDVRDPVHIAAKLTSQSAAFMTMIAGQALPAGFEEILQPTVVNVRPQSFAPAQLGDAVFAAQAPQHDADLLLRGIVLPRRPADILDDLLQAPLPDRISDSSSLLDGYDGTEILPSSTPSVVSWVLTADGPRLQSKKGLTHLP